MRNRMNQPKEPAMHDRYSIFDEHDRLLDVLERDAREREAKLDRIEAALDRLEAAADADEG
jgi:hypothetical protein